MKRITSFILLTLVVISSNTLAAINEAPEINLPTVDGNVQLDKLKGRVVYLDFWASWCLPCKESFPWMNKMKQAYAEQGFEVVAINLDKERKLADEFLTQVDVNFIVAFDESGESASTYKLKGMPSSYLIDRNGKVYASHVGFKKQDALQLEQTIKNLLNK